MYKLIRVLEVLVFDTLHILILNFLLQRFELIKNKEKEKVSRRCKITLNTLKVWWKFLLCPWPSKGWSWWRKSALHGQRAKKSDRIQPNYHPFVPTSPKFCFTTLTPNLIPKSKPTNPTMEHPKPEAESQSHVSNGHSTTTPNGSGSEPEPKGPKEKRTASSTGSTKKSVHWSPDLVTESTFASSPNESRFNQYFSSSYSQPAPNFMG